MWSWSIDRELTAFDKRRIRGHRKSCNRAVVNPAENDLSLPKVDDLPPLAIPIRHASRPWLITPYITRWRLRNYLVPPMDCCGLLISKDCNSVRLCKWRAVKIDVKFAERNQVMDVIAAGAVTCNQKQFLRGRSRAGIHMRHQKILCAGETEVLSSRR